MPFKKSDNVKLSQRDFFNLTGNAVVLPSDSGDHIVIKNSKGLFAIYPNGLITKLEEETLKTVYDLPEEQLISKFVEVLNNAIELWWVPFYIKNTELMRFECTGNKDLPFTLSYGKDGKMHCVLTSAPILFGLASGLLDFMLFENMMNTRDFELNHWTSISVDACTYHLNTDSEDSFTWDYHLLSQDEPMDMIKEFLRYVLPTYL